MNFMRNNWFNFLPALIAGLVTMLLISQPDGMTLLLWLSLGALFCHQFEEWYFPGYFPIMLNTALFQSGDPNRYPLNTNSAMLINVFLGWGGYILAALFWSQAIWLAIATMIVSIGNVVAHTIIFNIKGKTLYNPGLITSWVLFVPISYLFFAQLTSDHLVKNSEWVIGVLLGLALNYFGVYKMVIWLADKNTNFAFPDRFLKSFKTFSLNNKV